MPFGVAFPHASNTNRCRGGAYPVDHVLTTRSTGGFSTFWLRQPVKRGTAVDRAVAQLGAARAPSPRRSAPTARNVADISDTNRRLGPCLNSRFDQISAETPPSVIFQTGCASSILVTRSRKHPLQNFGGDARGSAAIGVDLGLPALDFFLAVTRGRIDDGLRHRAGSSVYQEARMSKLKVDYVAFTSAVVIPPLLVLALVPVRDTLGNQNVALILMAVVVAVAATGRRLAAMTAAVSSAVWFDFFLTQPYYSFAIDRHEDIVSVVLLIAAGLVVSQVAIWGRRQQGHAERTISEVSAVRAIAEMVATEEPHHLVIMTAAFWLKELLHLRDCRYEDGPGQASEAEIRPDGTVHVGSLRWAAETQGLPGPEVRLGVRYGDAIAGYFVLEPTPGEPVSEDRLFTASAIADEVGASYAAHGSGR
jgi:hypothetical protein